MGDNSITKQLRRFGLTRDESEVVLCLLRSPKTLLAVSRITGIARSSVYSLAGRLMDKGILHRVMSSDDKLLVGVMPETLELLIVAQEQKALADRLAFADMLPVLKALNGQDGLFSVRSYSGISGVKQMLWNELKTKTDILIFSYSSIDVATGKKWAERYRGELIDRGISQRAVSNQSPSQSFSSREKYREHYISRYVAKNVIEVNPELTIHDDVVSIYGSWDSSIQLGTEIKSEFFARFMRQVFEKYWESGKGVIA